MKKLEHTRTWYLEELQSLKRLGWGFHARGEDVPDWLDKCICAVRRQFERAPDDGGQR
jgi:hypothetical protein